MLAYALRRIAAAVPTLLVIVTVSFFVIRLAPGGPFTDPQRLPPQVRANLEAAYGLDEPLLKQYLRYLAGVTRGDFGPSLSVRDASVTQLIAQALPISLTLGLTVLLIALPVGVGLGVLAALRQGGVIDRSLTGITLFGLSLPTFVTAPVLALVFGLYLGWVPVGGWRPGEPRYLVLPVATLVIPVAAHLARLMRGSLVEALHDSHVRTARAKGLGPARVIWRHALRPALLPVVSYLGPAAAAILTGSLVVEQVFAIPGSGRFLVHGAIERDYSLVMGMITVYGSLTLLCNLAADLLCGWLDPRVRYE